MHLRDKIRSWLIVLITPKTYHRLHRKFKKHKLWTFDHSSISRGLAAGLLFAFIPLPIQMIPSVFLAILINGNILIAAGTVFISNPFTFIPINYFILKVGGYVTGQTATLPPIHSFNLNPTDWPYYIHVLEPWVEKVGNEFLIGLLIVSCVASCIGYILINLIWLIFVKLMGFKSNAR